MARSRHVAALLTLFVLSVRGVPCAGWQSTEQGRHDCCIEGQCPAQLESSSHSHDMSQAEADRCCATSEERQQQQSAQSFGVIFVVAAPVELPASFADAVRPPEHLQPDVLPVPSPPARLHLLFSVFLV
jgi:hypothetical protein